jgi:hypothetical protein
MSFGLVMGFTHPFAQDGSVNTDNDLLEQRIEKAQQNKIQEKRAEHLLKQQRQEEMKPVNAPQEKTPKRPLNDAEKLVK